MSINVVNSFSFKGLPQRRYPYVLPNNVIGGQEEEQMPQVRKEIAECAKKLDKKIALSTLQSALIQAKPYLRKSRKAQNVVLEVTNDELAKTQVENRRLELLMKCSAQSAFQQDKHDAIWLFNRLSLNPEFNRDSALYTMAPVFRNLDRKYDTAEIAKAEETLKAIFNEQKPVVQADVYDLYGKGKNINFNI